MKQKGEVIQGKYQVINAFPFVEGTLYFAAVKADGEMEATRFIHAVPMAKEPSEQELDELLNRNRDIFFPIVDVFVEEGVFYQVFDRMEGDLFPIYLKQAAPLSLNEIAQIVKKLSNHLLQCYDEDQFAYVDLQNMVRSPVGDIRFLYGGPMNLFGVQRQEPTDSKRLGKILFAMLTGRFIADGTEDAKELRSIRPDLPLDLEQLILQAFHLDPIKRPRIRDFWKWAHQFQEESAKNQKTAESLPQPVQKEPLPPSTHPLKMKPPAISGKNANPMAEQTPEGRKKRIFSVIGAIVAALFLILIGQAVFGESAADALGEIYISDAETDEAKAFQYFQESNVAYERKQLDQAIELGRRALSSDLEQKGYYLHLANLYGVSNDYKKGKQVLEAAAIQFPDEADVHDALSVYAYYLKDYHRALEAANKAVELESNNAGYLYHQAKVHLALKQYDQAVKSFQFATYVNRQSARYYHDLAIALYRTGKLDEAIKQAKKAVKEAEGSKEKYYLTLGLLYLKKWDHVAKESGLSEEKKQEQLKDLARLAYREFNDAVDEEKDFPEAQYYRSVAHYLYGNYKTANSAAEKAAKLDPKKPLYHYQLGLTFIALGNKEEALKALETAYQLDANNPLYQEAIKKAQAIKVKMPAAQAAQ